MTNKLFVAGISYNITSEQLGAHFAAAGQVISSNVITDKFSGQSKGFGFVEMSSEAEAKTAMDTLNNSTLDGRTIVVKEAKPMEPRSNTGGFRSNRDSGGGGDRRDSRDRNNRGRARKPQNRW